MVLMGSAVEMEDVKGRKSVAVLISVEDDSNLVKDDLRVHLWRFVGHGFVDDDSSLTCDWFQNILVRRRFCELFDAISLVDLVSVYLPWS